MGSDVECHLGKVYSKVNVVKSEVFELGWELQKNTGVSFWSSMMPRKWLSFWSSAYGTWIANNVLPPIFLPLHVQAPWILHRNAFILSSQVFNDEQGYTACQGFKLLNGRQCSFQTRQWHITMQLQTNSATNASLAHYVSYLHLRLHKYFGVCRIVSVTMGTWRGTS